MSKIFMAFGIIFATALAGCGGNPTGKGETVGTVGGAVAGGAVGSAATGGSTVGTVGGAVVGGVIGNEVGERYDERNRK
jgi:osmotically inducible lipoprotein OsmB